MAKRTEHGIKRPKEQPGMIYSITEKLAGLLGNVTSYQGPEEIPLTFDVDRDERDRIHVEVSGLINGIKKPISSIRSINRYGNTVEIDGQQYTVKTEDFETLLSIFDRYPTITSDGELIFDLYPPELEHLKTQPRVEQSERVGNLTITDSDQTEATLQVDFDPEEGISAEAGFSAGEDSDLIAGDEVEALDGDWYKKENELFQKPEISDEAEEIIAEGERDVELDEIPEFFLRDLAQLKSDFTVDFTEEAQRIEVSEEPPSPTISMDQSDKGWLDFEVNYEVGEQEISQSEMMEAVEQSTNGEPVRIDEYTWSKVDEEKVKETEEFLQETDSRETSEGHRVSMDKYQQIERFVNKIGGKKEASQEYYQFLSQLEGFSPDPDFQPPAETEQRLQSNGIHLREYQRKGIHWLHWLDRHHLHGLLADDMGLGKTLQSLVGLKQAYTHHDVSTPSLILSPKSVMGHWMDEARKVFHPQNYTLEQYHGPGRRPSDIRNRTNTIFFSTYGTIRSDIRALSDVQLFYVVLDEATKIKNKNAGRTQAAKSLNAQQRLGLSGTPIENKVEELWSIYDFLMKGHLGDYKTFQKRYGKKIKGKINTPEEEQVVEEIQEQIDPFFLRREKDNVADELPEKITNEYYLELTNQQKKYYAGIQKQFKENNKTVDQANQTSIFAVIKKLKQVCIHPAIPNNKITCKNLTTEEIQGQSNKFDRVHEKVREVLEKGEKAVVFSQFLDSLTLMETLLSDVNYIRIDGSTNNRKQLIEDFNNMDTGVALCSTKACEHGINLQTANHVLHMDFWWNPATKRQATDRVHRLGQEKTVHVHEFYVENTLEEKIQDMLETKQSIADSVISDSVKSLTSSLSKEELQQILTPIS